MILTSNKNHVRSVHMSSKQKVLKSLPRGGRLEKSSILGTKYSIEREFENGNWGPWFVRTSRWTGKQRRYRLSTSKQAEAILRGTCLIDLAEGGLESKSMGDSIIAINKKIKEWSALEKRSALGILPRSSASAKDVETWYLSYIEKEKPWQKPPTSKSYVSALKRICGLCGGDEVTKLDRDDAREAWRKEGHVETGFNSVVRKAKVLFSSSALKYYRANYSAILQDPFSDVDWFYRNLNLDKYEPLSNPEAEKLEQLLADLEDEKPKVALYGYLALWFGLRSGEIDHARISWFRERSVRSAPDAMGVIKVTKSEGYSPKSNKEREIPYLKEQLEKINMLHAKCGGGGDSLEFVVPYIVKDTGHQRSGDQPASNKPHSCRLGTINIKLGDLLGDNELFPKELKKIHALRKEFGSRVWGLPDSGPQRAQAYLGHASMITTEKHYATLR